MTSGSHPVMPGGEMVTEARRTPKLVRGVVTGARHLRDGKVCQDAVGGACEGDVSVLAVADGHGTSVHGDVGAALAVEVAVGQLLRFARELGPGRDAQAVLAFAEHPLRVHLVREWGDRVRQHAGGESVDLQPYGSTLLFALATPEYVLLGQIGDGDILVVDCARQVRRPIPPDPRNFADATTSLCQANAWTVMRLHAMPAPAGETLLLVSTDGYSTSYETDAIFELVGPDYLDMLRERESAEVEQQLPEILGMVSAGGSGDDIALGMLHWGSTGSAPGEVSPPATQIGEGD